MADKPVTREEKYLAYLTGDYKGELPKPITRKEKYLYELCLKGIGGEISPEEIKNAVNEYLEKNPVKPGATTEQAQQIEQNKKDVASLKTDLSNKITKFYASNQGETHITDSDNGKIMDMMLYGKSSQDGTPTIDNPVEIESVVNPKVVVYGKNIAKKVTVVDEPQQYITSLYIVADLRPSATYVLSFECASGYSGYINEKLFEQITFRGTGNRQRVVCKTKSALQSSELSEKGWRIAKNVPGNTIVPKFTNVMLERISASIAYEPYHEQTITLPCTLNAIPVSSGGNVVIDGQQYIADYVDVERGELVRMVDSSKLDNTQSIVNKTEWLLAEPQEIDLTQEEAQTLKALATYYPTTNISINSEQLDGYTVFNYPTSFEDEWNKTQKEIGGLKEETSSLKEDIGEIPKKQGYLSSYITDSTIKIDNEIYDVTTIIDELLKKGCKKIVVDVDCYVQKSIIPKNGIEIVGNGKSVIYFESGDGFNFSEGSSNASIHDLIIKGYNIQDDVNVKDNWLINISSDLHNVKLYNLDIESGYNGIKINGWINNYQNIIVSSFKGIGVYIGRSDNTFNTFYINGCRKEGLYISSSNNRIDNIKILSCGRNSNSSCFFKGNRNTISNVEIQDIYNKCAIFEDFNNNILNINLDGIRTHITDDASIVLAEFANCSRNVINLISSKYGSSVNDSSKDDIISLNSNCNTNSLILSSLKVALQDGGVKNNITVLKNDIVSYNIDKILTLEETYSVKKPTAINYIECTNISNEYSDAMYAFKNSGNVTYSGPRFTLKEKQKLFCVVVLSSNSAYNEQTKAILLLGDQQGNSSHVKSIGNLESYQVLTLIGADDASLLSWYVSNSTMNSSTITKIKYIGFFDFKNYSAIMSDIIN